MVNCVFVCINICIYVCTYFITHVTELLYSMTISVVNLFVLSYPCYPYMTSRSLGTYISISQGTHVEAIFHK